MSTAKETGKKPKKPAESGSGKGGQRKPKASGTDLVDQMIGDFKKKLKEGEVKVTVGDFIRLLQLQGEMREEEPKEIRVTWVEPTQQESTNAT
jgi:hypothetical protein